MGYCDNGVYECVWGVAGWCLVLLEKEQAQITDPILQPVSQSVKMGPSAESKSHALQLLPQYHRALLLLQGASAAGQGHGL